MPYKFAKTIKVHTSFVHSVAFSPAGAHFASAGADRKLFVHDGSTGDTLGELNGGGAHTGGIFACSWSADGKQVASSSADMTVTLWDVETRHAVQCELSICSCAHWSSHSRSRRSIEPGLCQRPRLWPINKSATHGLATRSSACLSPAISISLIPVCPIIHLERSM